MARILFVCTGNTCRSPMAEALLANKGIPGVEVRSAGVFAANGSDASLHAKKVMEENNLSLSHRSSLLTESEVGWATLILTMTESHKGAVLSYFPDAAGKIYTLKEFAGEQEGLDIADPFGGNVGLYRESFKEIAEAIEKSLEYLKD
ncbi:low molecular weight protein arginine phosphatase [Mesobacillus zeae]|uniref:Low molecular weight protein arginine phosphatase n=1 Tax=Mesobacillus zeae TaxID=1917180 RepID=A0A398AZC4_9BACI|nr:low molecular weight protein arginine phosphatase [Mesobacillus zeae]RID82394.1 low molecular weight protein arginine phosphatase [Mesobacillus zeae]